METKTAIGALQSLAQETRLAVFRLLVRAGAHGLTAGEIATALNVPGPTLSFHLKHLCHAGLIDCQREGRSLWYRASFTRVRDLLAYLMEDCCQGRPEFVGQQPSGTVPEAPEAGSKKNGCC